MRQPPVILDSALQTLRQETPSPEAAQHVRITLAHRPRRGALIPRLAAFAAVSAGVVFLWPHEKASAAWGIAAKNSAAAPIFHRVERNRKGVIVYELWVDNGKRAFVLRDERGKLACEMRINDERFFDFFEPIGRTTKNPNSILAAISGPIKEPWPKESGQYDLISTLLARKDVVVVEQRDVDTPLGDAAGKGTFYKLKTGDPRPETLSVDTERGTGRIRRVVAWPSGTIAIVEYPKSIDPSVFTARPQAAANVTVFDLSTESEQATNTMSRPLATKNGVTLRLAVLDAEGHLWVFWTGNPPDGKLSRPFLTPHVKAGAPFGLRAFTQRYQLEKASKPAPAIGQRLEGMAREILVKVGTRIDIDVPTRGGYASFKGVEILRVRNLHDLDEVIGLR